MINLRTRLLYSQLAFLLCVITAGTLVAAERVQDGLIVLYDFESVENGNVKDVSNVGSQMNLKTSGGKDIKLKRGVVTTAGRSAISTPGSAEKVIDAVRKTNAITVEAWIKPANTSQDGPARIVSISSDTSNRNITLGQDGNKYDVRLRTTKTSNNGIPSLSGPSGGVNTKLTHVVYTRDAKGNAKIYRNGEQRASKNIPGDMRNWNRDYKLIIANERTSDRPWAGEIHLVAIYNKALNADQVKANFKAGVNLPSLKELNAKLFETKIAPMFANHCLECHGAKKKKGKLDLSHKITAFQGGKEGKAIVPGHPTKSLLWESVESNEMPEDRPPLSLAEKKLLKQWIEGGAEWPLDVIDANAYEKDNSKQAIWVQRLTIREYIETVRATVGVDITADALKILPKDLRADGFSNTAYNLSVDLGHVNAYSRLAEIIVGKFNVKSFTERFVKGSSFDESHMQKLITEMGTWMLRGELKQAEIKTYQNIAKAVEREGGQYHEAVSFMIEAMLQSPRFIYRIETQRGDGGQRRVTGYELASRLSYILWGAPPDKTLMQAAASGALNSDVEIENQVKRMMRDPRVVDQSLTFVYEWLNLGRMDYLKPDPKRFPKWDPSLANDMRDETLAFFKDVVWMQKRPLGELFNAQVTYLTPRLAKHYGIPTQAPNTARYNLKSVPERGGLLTHGSVLTMGGDNASMVTRGLFVMHQLLRGEVDDPPPGLDTTPVPSKPGQSQRDVSIKRLADRSCGGCHERFEPLSYGLEIFNGLGAYQAKDAYGNRMRQDGEILFPDTKTPVKYQTAGQMMDILAKSERVSESITRKVIQFALGRPLLKTDEPEIAKIHQATVKAGGTYSALIQAIVLSDLVLKTRTEQAK